MEREIRSVLIGPRTASVAGENGEFRGENIAFSDIASALQN